MPDRTDERRLAADAMARPRASRHCALRSDRPKPFRINQLRCRRTDAATSFWAIQYTTRIALIQGIAHRRVHDRRRHEAGHRPGGGHTIQWGFDQANCERFGLIERSNIGSARSGVVGPRQATRRPISMNGSCR